MAGTSVYAHMQTLKDSEKVRCPSDRTLVMELETRGVVFLNNREREETESLKIGRMRETHAAIAKLMKISVVFCAIMLVLCIEFCEHAQYSRLHVI